MPILGVRSGRGKINTSLGKYPYCRLAKKVIVYDRPLKPAPKCDKRDDRLWKNRDQRNKRLEKKAATASPLFCQTED